MTGTIDKTEEELDLEKSERGKSDREKNELESEFKSQRELLQERNAQTQQV